MNTMNTDFAVLVNKEIPWNIDKIKLLDEAVKLFYNNPAHPVVRNRFTLQSSS